MARVGIVGSTGRVGNLLIDSLLQDEELPLSAVHVFDELKRDLPSNVLVTNSMKVLLENCDVVIDFSAPDATQDLCEAALKNPTALVIATTGFTEHQQNLLKEASKEMPVLYASNMSAGIALLKQLVEQVAATLKDFDIEIVAIFLVVFLVDVEFTPVKQTWSPSIDLDQISSLKWFRNTVRVIEPDHLLVPLLGIVG